MTATLARDSTNVLSLVTYRYATFYENQVAALESNGVDLTHVCPPKQAGRGVDISRSVSDYVRMYGEVLRQATAEYDLVHANNGLITPLAITQPHRPIVLTLWGSDLMGDLGWLTERYPPLVDKVVVPSERMAEHLSADATVVPFGLDTERFAPMPRREARETLGWPTDRSIVLFPASPTRSVKNFPVAKSVVESLSIDVDLRSLGRVAHEDMPLYLNASDCVLITSRREGGPMTLKEATLCNVPVVSTDVGFASEVLKPLSNSHVCDSREELRESLESVLTSNERSNGRARYVDEMSIERMGKRLLDVYERVLD